MDTLTYALETEEDDPAFETLDLGPEVLEPERQAA